MALKNGTRIGPYEILSPLGAGGMGEVYRASDTRLGREVAVKVLPDSFAGNVSVEERFLREARAVASLSHPNILALFDVGSEEGRSYAVMELLEGETLRVWMTRSKLPWQKAVEIGTSIADGLAAAHGRGIVHRDLKPENVFITSDGRVKILDFGLARVVPMSSAQSFERTDMRPGVSEPGAILGTVGYMSPEQARGLPAEATSDLFALGCILYELVTGVRAFSGASAGDVFASLLRDDPPEVSSLVAEVPGELSRLIQHCLEKNPDQRSHSARDVTFQLRGIVSAQTPGSASSGAKRSSIQSIAVCPFTNASGNAEADYLCEGIAGSIIGSLSTVPNLRVMSRTTMARYRGREIDPVEIGRELGVRALLSGHVFQQGDRLSVHVELVHTDDGSALWSENYNRTWTDIFAIEEEIARQISERLRIRLRGEDAERLRRRGSDDAEAYRLFLKGRFYCEKRSSEGLKRGIAHFQEAIEQDPLYAQAYAGIAEAYNLMGFYMHASPSEAFPKARAAASRALEIDPLLADARSARGYTHFYFDWDWAGAEREFRKAIALDGSHVATRQFYAAFLIAMGRDQEAVEQLDFAEDLDPLALPVKTARGWCLFLARRHRESIEALEKVLEMEPNFETAHLVIGWPLVMTGRAADAMSHLLRIAADAGAPGFYRSSLAHCYAMAGEREAAGNIFRELQGAGRYVSAFQLALISEALGDRDRAFEYLDAAVQERGWPMVMVRRDPRLDTLRDDPRFARVLEAVGST